MIDRLRGVLCAMLLSKVKLAAAGLLKTPGCAFGTPPPKSHGFRGIARLWELPRGAMRREFRLDAEP
jgi:hypothetical protein